MRKRAPQKSEVDDRAADWLDLEQLAEVEVSSEDPQAPIEAALVSRTGAGWRAAEPGVQTLRLIFDEPQRIGRIRLRFVETVQERTQEFVLRWSADGKSFHDIVRQRWNFSPQGATREDEDFRVNLSDVTVLELTITPDISHGPARATLAEMRLA